MFSLTATESAHKDRQQVGLSEDLCFHSPARVHVCACMRARERTHAPASTMFCVLLDPETDETVRSLGQSSTSNLLALAQPVSSAEKTSPSSHTAPVKFLCTPKRHLKCYLLHEVFPGPSTAF